MKFAQILVLPNGMLAVFDEHDMQVPKYQGRFTLWRWLRIYIELKRQVK